MPIRAPHAWAEWMALPRGHPVRAGGGGAAPSQLPGRGHHDWNGRSRPIWQLEEHPSDGLLGALRLQKAARMPRAHALHTIHLHEGAREMATTPWGPGHLAQHLLAPLRMA
jgi:hypothetical protein